MTQRNQIYQGVDAHSTYEDDFIIVVVGHFLGFVDNGNCIHIYITVQERDRQRNEKVQNKERKEVKF